MQPIKLLAIGSDPELFFITQKGQPQSAEGLVGGTKAKPLQMKNLPQGYMIQEDNVACEFNIPPASNATDFSNSIQIGLNYISKIAKSKKLKLAIEPALYFPEEQLQSAHAKTFGCDPDFNIWTLDTNAAPQADTNLRTAAGHIHISWLDPQNDQRKLIGRACDLFLGVPSILCTDPSPRRTLYGKAGAIRIKDYGLEYRTLDNFWLGQKKYRLDVFNKTKAMMVECNFRSGLWSDVLEDFKDEIVTCINNHDRVIASFLMERFNITPFSNVDK